MKEKREQEVQITQEPKFINEEEERKKKQREEEAEKRRIELEKEKEERKKKKQAEARKMEERILEEEFIYNFISDKYFMYRLLYCYQSDNPPCFGMDAEQMGFFLTLLQKMKSELLSPVADSYHMIVAYLYEFLLLLNRY